MKIISRWWFIVAVLLGTETMAAESDRNAPVLIEAAEVMIDEPSGVSTYKGDVSFQQGGMSLQADQVDVHSDGRILRSVVATGAPVVFEITDVDGDVTRAEAQNMRYQVADGHLVMVGEARLWQGGNHFSGGRIEFDTYNDRILASRQGEEKQRVRVVIHPETLNQQGIAPVEDSMSE